MSSARKIVTHYVYPPIPIRTMDWAAWFDDVGPEGPTGSGATEEEAIRDLLENADA